MDKVILAIIESFNCSESTAEKRLTKELDKLSELYLSSELNEMDLEQSCNHLGISYDYTDTLLDLILDWI